MTPRPAHIAIVGGGTAGWMAACLFARHWGPQGCRITLLESSEIGIIGVGEGSTPYLRHFFAELGITEAEWMPACQASYKSGIRFPGWSTVAGYQSYVHPFFNEQDLSTGSAFFVNACLRRRGVDADANPQDFFIAAALAAQCRAPVARPADDGRAPATDYAYHFDAGLLGQFLRRHAQGRGVVHRIGTVARVQRHESGAIEALQLADGEQLAADFFIDCSGFRGLLISETLGEPFISYKHSLFNDRAIAIPTALDAKAPIPSETNSTALRHGWAWQIPLQSRYGNGYVYASDFVSDDDAETELRAHLGPAAEGQPARRLQMRVGRVERHWRDNCLALGLSQGFIEPLEATALMLIQFAVAEFIASVDAAGLGPAAQSPYNRRVNQMFDGVRDYVLGHYRLNTRTDSDYWRANRANTAGADRLLSLLEVWDRGGDFEAELSRHGDALMYQRPSWYCLFAGMGRFPAQLRPPQHGILSGAQARAAIAAIAAAFPTHREQLQSLIQRPS
ncbi:tryptophan halogenase family protein [Paucibacter sp. APW11]|uniref:Tryptophan halogenase family protein n=1 Tax=Roseateles aquae TaxID=3077235 RepID=A0ABU3PFP7_9BURK|nr:tryptophan halogenase family protein [Paucibacter sp. APW11]MDT9001425.1 tryptophan halogenase family protein [Paucibacter sp. APW11]